jgi:hypothetical protein
MTAADDLKVFADRNVGPVAQLTAIVLAQHSELLAACKAFVAAVNDHEANHTAAVEASRLAQEAIKRAES